MADRRAGDDAATWAVVLEELELARKDRAELRTWMTLTVEDLRATMELMRQQHQEQIEELKKTRRSITGRLQSGSPNWKALLPPSWQS